MGVGVDDIGGGKLVIFAHHFGGAWVVFRREGAARSCNTFAHVERE